MNRIKMIAKLRLARAVILAAVLWGPFAWGQVNPHYGYTNLAGLGGTSGALDGTNTTARFSGPYGIEVDAQHNAYVADCWNHSVRKITPDGVVTTFAGTLGSYGSADGTNAVARFNGPMSTAVDIEGNVFVSDTFNSTIRKITPTGVVTTLAGAPGATGSTDGTNSQARFYMQRGIAVDNAGYVYVADYYNCLIRKVSPVGVVTTLAGATGIKGSTDGSTNVARFYYPTGVAVDTNGNVFVADGGNHTIRKISAAGVVSTVAGLAGASGSTDGTNTQARFGSPNDVAVDNSGNLYVADGVAIIRKITPEGVVTTIGGLAGASGTVDGTNSQARFGQVGAIAVDDAGNLYIADWTGQRIAKGTPIYPPPPIIATTSPLPTGTTGIAYNTSLMATGGVAPYTWAIAAGGLPEGLSLSAAGVLSGTPTMATNATFLVKVTGANSACSTNTYSITIFAPPAILTGSPLSSGISGTAYSQTLVGTGGQLPYTWAIVSGTLPAGLNLSTDGVISGTPTTVGDSSFSIAMTANNGVAVTNAFTLAVSQGVPLTESFNTTSMPAGWTQEYVVDTVNWVFQKGGHNNANPANPHSAPYNALLWASGTTEHKTKLVTPMIDFGSNTAAQLTFWVDTKVYYLYQDNLGVYYKTNATAPWILLGNWQYTSWSQVTLSLPTPTRTYYIGFEGNARGGYGVLLDDVSVVAVAPPAAPTILGGNRLPTGTVGAFYNQTLSASGGTAPYTWSVASGTLPSGLNLSTSGVLSGNPSAAGNTSIRISVAGVDGMASTNLLTLAINNAPTATDPLYAFTNWIGQAGSSGSTDGTNSQPRFSSPIGVSLDSTGNLYVGDSWNHTIRKITPDGTVTTLAGLAGVSGTNDGVGSLARFYNPAGVSVDTNGVIYVADENNSTIRAVTAGGVVTTIAGTPGRTGIDPEDPNWYCFWQPTGVAATDDGVYVADTVNNTISHVWKADGEITILAGYYEGSTDGTGLNAQFRWPQGLAVSQGAVYVADTGNSTIRNITSGGVTTTLAGSPGLSGSADGTNSAARFMTPYAVAVDGSGNVFVVDRDNHNIRKISPAGVVTTIGGLAGTSGSTDDVGLGARFKSPQGIAVDKDGVLYIADTGNNRIVRGTPVSPVGGTIQWAISTVQADETSGGITLSVARSGSTVGNVSCNYATADGTATAGSDYLATNGVLTWSDGDGAAKSVFVPIVNDGQPEESENLTVLLTGPSVGTLNTATITLTDDDTPTRIVRLSGDLNFGTVTIGQATNRTVTIYNDGNSPMQISSIQTPADFSVSGVGDGIVPAGGSRTVEVTFLASTAQTNSGNLLVLCDATSGVNTLPVSGTAVNPPAGVLQLAVPELIIGEDAGQVRTKVSRIGGSFGTVSCNYRTDDNTAWAGLDYTLTTGTLTWTNGETADKDIVVSLMDDSAIEGQEDFMLRLTAGPIGDPAGTIIRITDNDVGASPTITRQPAGATVQVGADVAFDITAVGTPPLSYQWRKDGTDVIGETGIALSLTNVQTNHAGNYIVVVTNVYGSITSGVATLVVNGLTNTSTVLVEDLFNGANGATPDPAKWDWSGQVSQNGAGLLSVQTQTSDLSWLKSKSGSQLGAGQSLVALIRTYAYAESWNPGVYGDKQPRGLRVGTDANNAIEFYSASRVLVGMRCRKGGVETSATYSLPAGVDSQHDYEISVTTTSVVFKVDGITAGTLTANIPTGTLNLYIDSNDGGGVGNVPLNMESARLTLNAPPALPPRIVMSDGKFGIQTNRFGFTITGTSGSSVVVEGSTNLASGWFPIWTNTLTDGAAYFSDPTGTNSQGRFYRVR